MATIRGTGIQSSSASSYVVTWPAGTVANDLAVIMVGHGWVASAPSGWTSHDAKNGSNWNGAVLSKILNAADITAGSVTVTFSGSFNGTVAIITFVGHTGFAVSAVTSSRNGPTGSTSIAVSTTLPATPIDPVIYWGSNRAASTDTVDRGTMQRQVNAASASGCLYTETGATGSITATFAYPTAGTGNYQAIIVLGPPPIPDLTLECAGTAVMSSAYFVVLLSRKNIPVGDLPPVTDFRMSGTGRITTLDTNIDNWYNFTPANPAPVHGVWNAATTYAIGNTVSSANRTIENAAGTELAPLTYRSLVSGNVGHDPDDYEGYWTCITQPPHIANSNYVPCPFGYVLSPLPNTASLAATTWKGKFWHSLSWGTSPPGDVVQLMDMYVKMNYLVGGSIVPVLSRPQTAAKTADNPGASIIYHPGINAQFQTWFTSGLAFFPEMTLSNFQPTPVNGFEASGVTGTAYLSALVASGGVPPYAYAIVAGSLPAGVTLDGTTGILSGTPEASGIFTFTAQVTDSAGVSAQVTCSLPVDCGGGEEPTGAARNYAYIG